MKKVLIANRGEIAVRIARACDEMGFETVAVYADDDLGSVHVSAATEAYSLDGVSAADSYLDGGKLLAIASRSGADAVHPGYGFLSENADFAQAVLDAGLTWIGPDPETIRVLGDKVSARAIAVRAGAPLAPGTDGAVETVAEVRAFADRHGLPVVIKAAFGGGGRGMKVVREVDEIAEAFAAATRESVAAFGRGECFVEKYLERPRHIEVQVLADRFGAIVAVGTRDCSLQRRHQKLVEEAPAPFLTGAQHDLITSAAKAVCREAGYVGAGTVEFLLAADGTVSFLEVNTRLQVEHPVTEETTGIDLVQAQLVIADGGPLGFTADPVPVGHSFEFRINAEDVALGFLPSPGTVTRFEVPTGPGIRVDSGVRAGSVVPGGFDSLLAKLIVTGRDREHALRRARRALAEFEVSGVATVLPFHRAIVGAEAFTGGAGARGSGGAGGFAVHTTWIETEFLPDQRADPEFSPSDGRAELVAVTIEVDGRRVNLRLPPGLLGAAQNPRGAPDVSAAAAEVLSPIAGTVVAWRVAPGDVVAPGDAVLVLEAMKMEVVVRAHRDGVVGALQVVVGDPVDAGACITTVGNR